MLGRDAAKCLRQLDHSFAPNVRWDTRIGLINCARDALRVAECREGWCWRRGRGWGVVHRPEMTHFPIEASYARLYVRTRDRSFVRKSVILRHVRHPVMDKETIQCCGKAVPIFHDGFRQMADEFSSRRRSLRTANSLYWRSPR